MKRISSFLILLFLSNIATHAQILIPKFEKAVKLSRLSSSAEESNIFTYNEGQNIFFYRTYVKGEGADMQVMRQNIWFSAKEDGKWTKPDRLFTMDDYQGENIIIGSSRDGMKVYIFQTVYDPSEDSLTRHIGFIEKGENGKWSAFQEFDIPGLVLGENYYHFHLSHNEEILMLSMSPNDELKDEDIFVSLKGKDGNWGKIINLGPTINTRRVEISPYIDEDGRTLFFSSEGHGGNGGSDVFVSYRLDDSWMHWTKPTNLGDSINTKDFDEYFVTTQGNEYYFTSNKDSESADIYYTTSDKAIAINTGLAIVLKKGKPIAIALQVLDKEGLVYDKFNSQADGKFKFKIKRNKDDLSFKSESEDAADAFIYFLDNKGNKKERLSIGKDLNSKRMSQLVLDQKLKGKILTANGVLASSTVNVMDVNGFKIAETTTDANGNFSISTSFLDQTISLSHDSIADMTLQKVVLYDASDKKLGDLAIVAGKIDKQNFVSAKPLAQQGTKLPDTKVSSTAKGAYGELFHTAYFEHNAISTDKKNYRKMRRTFRTLLKNEDKKVHLVGHTDDDGGDKLNEDVGMLRAKHIQKLLEIEGVNASRITIESKGESMPVSDNRDEKGRAENRRVEIFID